MSHILISNIQHMQKSVGKTLKHKRLFIPLMLLALLMSDSLRTIILQSLADAFLQVTIFVAVTLCIYYFLLDRFPMLDLGYVRINHPSFEVPVAAMLGALPGCGGAIIVVTQFTKKQASFGSVVAVLTATMGDAAFLLLATKPVDGAIILSMGLVVGIISGVIVNKIHPPTFLHPESLPTTNEKINTKPSFTQQCGYTFWRLWMLPSLVIGALLTTQFDFDTLIAGLNEYIMYFGAFGAFAVTLMWAMSSKGEIIKI